MSAIVKGLNCYTDHHFAGPFEENTGNMFYNPEYKKPP